MTQPGRLPDLHPKSLKNLYLQRYAWPGPLLSGEPIKGTNIIVVIPCYNEPHVLESLASLFKCEAPDCIVEIIVVLNHSEDDTEKIKKTNRQTLESIKKWLTIHKRNGFVFHIINAFDLPKKHAGVGLARKIGMDEAVRRFEYINNKDGIIACLDADCLCNPSYLKEVYNYYKITPNVNSASVYFEHPLEGDLDDSVYEGIINYELHLRFYKNALRFAEFPQSFHAIGSCITVTSAAYQKQGGMNKRKAGEDFYFLQKIFQLGNIHNINSTCVFPSPRPSDRVPFGTGKAVNDILISKKQDYTTYNPKTFKDLKKLIELVTHLYEYKDEKTFLDCLPESIRRYINQINFLDNLLKIKKNSSSKHQFQKSFYNWFNGFHALKYVHFARDNYYEETEILEATNWILNKFTDCHSPIKNKKEALFQMRQLDRLH